MLKTGAARKKLLAAATKNGSACTMKVAVELSKCKAKAEAAVE